MDKERYSRHLNLKNFGESRQQKLLDAKVLVIGAGGLGCPVLQYLTAAGVGEIGIADGDTVSLSNLQRQVLYTVDDISLPKAVQAAIRLQRLNPDIVIHTHVLHVDAANALELIRYYDIVVDGTDNFASRYLINDACVLLEKPLVYGAVYQYEGQVAVFNVADILGIKTNYRDLFATPPSAVDAPDCNDTGVIGVLPGIIGVLQATEVIKLITGIGKALINQLLTWSVVSATAYTVQLQENPEAKAFIPADQAAFRATDYDWLCSTQITGVEQIGPISFVQLTTEADVLFIDVRESGEQPEAHFPHLQIPLSRFKENLLSIHKNKVVLFCQSGKRSLQAAQIIRDSFGESKKVYSLTGGILTLIE
ncbi:HesA/MoeB/ThiF family protein [Pedobacter duraquae]|uniref:Molybdopterin-synthase adenylyltransferase n=1 Tax=Pedobacter duraquae TaxID=425511 RepID=A0A4R6IDA0_9SPHI|nr:HesA/MoeB/ThiF family protein [Pedobacter duraquae]TDO19567.1 adenylyltransferase/sulfurtransferase [Pedobacter duraquae]